MCKNIPHFGMKTSKFYTWIVSKKIYFPREKKQQNKMINRKKSLHTIRKKWENSLSLFLSLSRYQGEIESKAEEKINSILIFLCHPEKAKWIEHMGLATMSLNWNLPAEQIGLTLLRFVPCY